MFNTIVVLTIGLVLFLTFRDWLLQPRLSSKSIQKILNATSQHISLGEWESAKKKLSPLIENGKGAEQALFLHLQILRGTHYLQQALKIATEAARRYPEELLFRLEEGKILLKLGRGKEALAAFNVCSPIMRGESDGFALASALFQSGYPSQCLELIKPWLQTTQNGELLTLAADAFAEKKQFREAIDHYYKAMDRGFKTYQMLLQLGHAFRRLGNLAQSEKIFHKLLEKDSNDIPATLGLGACLQERGHYNKALLIYQSGKAWETRDSLILKQAAICALHAKKYHFAEHYLLEVIGQEEPHPQTLVYYGYSLESQRKWQEVEQVYLRIIQLFPSHLQ